MRRHGTAQRGDALVNPASGLHRLGPTDLGFESLGLIGGDRLERSDGEVILFLGLQDPGDQQPCLDQVRGEIGSQLGIGQTNLPLRTDQEQEPAKDDGN